MRDELRNRIALMAENWFLREPVYYAVYCTLALTENDRMQCPVRVGQGRLEYNPLALIHINYRETELLFRTEMIRVLMLHPYSRRPQGATNQIISIGSDITIGDNYCFIRGKEKLPVQTPEAYHLPLGMPYEWYVEQLRQRGEKQNPPQTQNTAHNTAQDTPHEQTSQDEQQAAHDKSSLWEEREVERERIRQLVDRTTEWGSIPANLVEHIRLCHQADSYPAHIIDGFRASVLSSTYMLTRMYPNRRTDFQQMGHRRVQQSTLLMAIDVSGSMTTGQIESIYRFINHYFVHCTAAIDLLTFDAEIQSVEHYRRIRHEITITGRGGTNYQPVFDYVAQAKQHYDGVVIFTDGEASDALQMHRLLPILWVLQHASQVAKHRVRLGQYGRVTQLV